MGKAIEKIYISCIRPILTYGNAITHGKTKGDSAVQRVNKLAMRMVTNLYTPISYEDLLLRCGWKGLDFCAAEELLHMMKRHVMGSEAGLTAMVLWSVLSWTQIGRD